MKDLKHKIWTALGLSGVVSAVAWAATTSPNMSLSIPSVGDTNYPTSFTNSLTLVDAHDHTSGKGVQVPNGGIANNAINAAKISDGTVTPADLALSSFVDDSTLEVSGSQFRVKNAGITRPKLAAVGQQVSSSSGTFSTSSTSYVDVTNLTVTITTTGRPVFLALIPDASGGAGAGDRGGIRSAGGGDLAWIRDSTTIAETTSRQDVTALATAPAVFTIDVVAAGTYVYKIQAAMITGSTSFNVRYWKLIAFEL